MGLQLLVFIVLAAFAGGMWFARDQVRDAYVRVTKGDGAGEAAKPKRRRHDGSVPVIVSRVAEATNREVIAAVGTARARRSVMLHPESDGIIVKFAPRAGDRVKQGEVIVQLDADKVRLAVQIANRRLQEAKRQFSRSEFLKSQSVNSKAKVEDAQTVLERAELEVLLAEETLQDLSIKAPFDGIVGIPNVEVGERVTTTTPLISLDQRDEVLVEFEVAEKYLSRIATGDAVAVGTPSYQDKSFAGRVEFIDSRIAPTSRTAKVRAVVPNKEDVLRPGMSFVVEVELPGERYAVVPELSLQWRKGESFVWTVEDGKARKVLVTVVSRLNSTILVSGELKPGELVVVEGVQRLRPGRPVDASETDATEAGTEQSAVSTSGDKG
jgi:RND family efflux transporter MFP subunit